MHRSLGTEGKVKFAEGVELDVEKSRDIGWGNDLIRYTTEFINMLKEISIDLTEYCILNAIVLTYPGNYHYTYNIFTCNIL